MDLLGEQKVKLRVELEILLLPSRRPRLTETIIVIKLLRLEPMMAAPAPLPIPPTRFGATTLQ